jgi:hypothetical protein
MTEQNKHEFVLGEKYSEIMKDVKSYYESLSKAEPVANYFTPHDSTHCIAVEKLVKALITKSKIELSELERFFYYCAYGHMI